MTGDEDERMPATIGQEPREVAVRSVRELEQMSDEDLLGADYRAWLEKRKLAARTTVTKGYDVRLKADDAMARAEEVLAKAEKQRGK